ncbi:MAG: NADP-dependent oxidoreductase [Proteobacteria bacterium]|nr:NADP-dependent oxidoreductase [Pseudomonadota bacterium]
MTDENIQVRLAARPVGLPADSDWEIRREAVPQAEDGQFVAEVLYVSLDPAMRGWMNAARSYIAPVEIGAVMRAGGIARIRESRLPGFDVGEHVFLMTGVQQFCVSDGKDVQKVNPDIAPLPTFLSVLGMTGLTAYFGVLEVGAIEAGETVVVSGAAGAVGSVVGQIARIRDCRVVGIAGGKQKCDYLADELGFDAAIDYKSEDLRDSLRQHCPKGVDVFFDNVGGDTLNTVLPMLRMHGRVVICGAISQYNNTGPVAGPSNYMSLLVSRARMEGFVVFDYAKKYPEAIAAMVGWLAEGRLKSQEQIEGGIENFPAVLLKLFEGGNFGKQLVKVGEE